MLRPRDMDSMGKVAAEAQARVLIDERLLWTGGAVQDLAQMDVGAAEGVAVQEVTSLGAWVRTTVRG